MLSREASCELIDKVLAVLAPRTPHQLFEQENKEAVISEMNRVSTKFKTAAKTLWDGLPEEEKSLYIERTENINIAANQEELPAALSVLLGSLGQSERVGGMEAMLVLCLRTPDGDIRLKSVVAGTSRDDYQVIKSTEFQEAVVKPFKGWSDSVLPQRLHRSNFVYDQEGLPLFPRIVLDEATGDQVKEFLVEYLEELWKCQYKDGSMLPWDPLTMSPGDYYDVQKYNFIKPLKHLNILGTAVEQMEREVVGAAEEVSTAGSPPAADHGTHPVPSQLSGPSHAASLPGDGSPIPRSVSPLSSDAVVDQPLVFLPKPSTAVTGAQDDTSDNHIHEVNAGDAQSSSSIVSSAFPPNGATSSCLTTMGEGSTSHTTPAVAAKKTRKCATHENNGCDTDRDAKKPNVGPNIGIIVRRSERPPKPKKLS
ncbi:hypothetical protein GYMLUDRAFT_251155 [Collybiopsis luxurians FD-317 M1]|uniref:Uncharacterized protein n=1 Tax=Collybiopsis luxurians FD-317 M1 TaxID=944289 RepID=A0A0D0CCF0_9AGAR|nr:hypothetical protein GYMLUDRAFT_251155 [Collybiopsis luxurians FD-317 M1]